MQYGTVHRVEQGGEVGWVFTAPNGQHTTNSDLVRLLNVLANQNWRVVVAGNFGGSVEDELILEHA